VKVDQKALRTYIIWLACLVVFVAIAIFLSFWTAIVFALFALAFLLDVSPLVPFAVALVLLVVCPFMVVVDQNGAAELFASWSYCFLAIGIAVQLVRYFRNSPKENSESE
jgi:hypothetical protein